MHLEDVFHLDLMAPHSIEVDADMLERGGCGSLSHSQEAPMWETLQGQLWVTEPWNSHTVHQATRIRPDSSDYTKVIPPQLLARSEEDLTHLSSFKQLPALMQFSPSLMSPRSKSHPGALPRKGSNGRAPLWASCMDTSLGRMHRTLASTVVYLLLQ